MLFDFLRDIDYESVEPPLTKAEIEEIEKLNEITLPEEYRQFLMTVGNGIRIKVGEGDTRFIYGFPRPLEKQFNRRYKYDFPFDTPFHDDKDTHDFPVPDDCLDPDSEIEGSCKKCIHQDMCYWSDAGDEEDYDHYVYNGACELCYAGCTYTYFLVLNGKHRGEVWINNEIWDFAPVKPSFSAFLEWVATAKYF